MENIPHKCSLYLFLLIRLLLFIKNDCDLNKEWLKFNVNKIEYVMFIQTEETPNPNTLKFLPGKIVMGAGTIDFRTKDAAKRSPLATMLFNINGISGVFLGANFISVSKEDSQDWTVSDPICYRSINNPLSPVKLLFLADSRCRSTDTSNHTETQDPLSQTNYRNFGYSRSTSCCSRRRRHYI
jgi:hypothetical protein